MRIRLFRQAQPNLLVVSGASVTRVMSMLFQLGRKIRACQETAVENQGLAGHKGGAVRAHPDDGLRDLHGLSKTAEGMEPDGIGPDLGPAENSLTHGRFDHRRTN